MEDPKEEFSDKVKRQVNVHGELHLDAMYTRILIDWLQTSERALRAYQDLGVGLTQMRDQMRELKAKIGHSPD